MVAQFHKSCNIKQDYVGMVEFIEVWSFEVVKGRIIVQLRFSQRRSLAGEEISLNRRL